MKNLLLTAIILMSFQTLSFGQRIKAARSLKSAFEESTQKNKPVLLIVYNPVVKGNRVKTLSNLSNYVYTSINSEDLTERIRDNFIVYATYNTDTTLNAISNQIELKSFPIYLFFRPNKDLYYRSFGLARDKPAYMKMLDEAQQAISKQVDYNVRK